MHSGRTVEINNTDAEGRMVLGDGVSYATRVLGCQTVIDIATLTGASSVTVGNEVAALLSNCEDLETKIRKIGRECGETAFPMIYRNYFMTENYLKFLLPKNFQFPTLQSNILKNSTPTLLTSSIQRSTVTMRYAAAPVFLSTLI